MIRFYVFRHGETGWNAEGRIQGSIDIPLSPVGERQAAVLAERLAGVGLEGVVTSDLCRARATGAMVARRCGVPFLGDARLREISLGVAEGLTRAEAGARFGDGAWRQWASSSPADLDFRFLGGESKREAVARFGAVLRQTASGPQRHIGISTHGALLRNAIHAVLPPEHPTLSIDNCAVHILQYSPGAHLWEYVGPL